MSNKRNPFDIKLDPEEKALLESIEQGEWESVDKLEEEIAVAEEAAQSYFKKDKRINIRLSSPDLKRIKRAAASEGLPYQTLVSSILHKYAKGR